MSLPAITVARTQPKTADAIGVAVAESGRRRRARSASTGRRSPRPGSRARSVSR